MAILAVVAGISKALAIINPEMFKSNSWLNHGLSYGMTFLVLFLTILLSTVYTLFYWPKKFFKSKSKTQHMELKLICANVVLFATFFTIKNIYIALLITAAVTLFAFDIIKTLNKSQSYWDKFWAIFAYFNAYFVNLILFIGFSFVGVNKLIILIYGSSDKVISMSINGMGLTTGVLMVILGFGGMYSSRAITASAIKNCFKKFSLSDMYENMTSFFISICALAVSIQAGYQTIAPTFDLFSSWGFNSLWANVVAYSIGLCTLTAVFALLSINSIKSKMNCSWGWYDGLVVLVATLTGVSTIPLGIGVNAKVAAWSIIAIFSSFLWFFRLRSPDLLTQNFKQIPDYTEPTTSPSCRSPFGEPGAKADGCCYNR